MGDRYTELLRVKAEERVVGRELYVIYMGHILSELANSFPEETNIDLSGYAGMAPFNMAEFSETEADVLEKQELTQRWQENYDKKLSIARGTLLTLVRSGLIHSPDCDTFAKSSALSLRACVLSERGQAAVFRKPDAVMEEQMKRISEELASADRLEAAMRRAEMRVNTPGGNQGGFLDVPALLEAFAEHTRGFREGASEQIPHILGIAMGAFLSHLVPTGAH